MFITLEGLDYSGKSTQADRLVRRLEESRRREPDPGPPVVFLREPGGTHLSERLREILLDRRHLAMSGRTELLLFAASRAQLVESVIRPALDRGSVVICDRFFDSTTAYQGYGRGLPLADVVQLNDFATGGLKPDLTIYFDVPIDEVERRRRATGADADRMESSGRAFYERVRDGYLAIVAGEPARCATVDGMAAPEAVEARVWDEVRARLERKRHEAGATL
jgi:dTMP kinase